MIVAIAKQEAYFVLDLIEFLAVVSVSPRERQRVVRASQRSITFDGRIASRSWRNRTFRTSAGAVRHVLGRDNRRRIGQRLGLAGWHISGSEARFLT
jgi:hypothetical protein